MLNSISQGTNYSEPCIRNNLESVVVRFAGDSGDGVQMIGGCFSTSTAKNGNDLATFPDFPAEIRAPAGTTYGVSAFQINFGARRIKTSGDEPDVLVALNPAALRVELPALRRGGLLIVDEGAFTQRTLKKAGYQDSPFNSGDLDGYRLLKVNVSALTLQALKPLNLTKAESLQCKNMWVLGLTYWLFSRNTEATEKWLEQKFSNQRSIADANIAALKAGNAYGETTELSPDMSVFSIDPAPLARGAYRSITGSEAMAWGLIAGSNLVSLSPFFASYPITPASPVLHILSKLTHLNVSIHQAEDEIAAVCMAIGASYAGHLGITSSSGPGISLKSEAISLAVACELPLVVINTQRAGPSTGMPTKTEQADLLQAIYGRHGESPVAVLASRSPADCFDVAIEAIRIATQFMTPVFVLSDGYISNAAQPWLIPNLDDYQPVPVEFLSASDGQGPFDRDSKTLARNWVRPGTAGLEHRIGGLEKDEFTGAISYDAQNHQRMVTLRSEKISRIADFLPEQSVEAGPEKGELVVVGWGSSFGAISRAVSISIEEGKSVAHIHLRNLWPLPRNLGKLLSRYRNILVPELNTGQLRSILRDQLLVDAKGFNKVSGQPFKIMELREIITQVVGG